MRKHNLLHRVECAECGKTERIEIRTDGSIPSEWKYFGRININACKTDKYFFEVPEGVDWNNTRKWKKIPNKFYDPKAKKKEVEIWECGSCFSSKVKQYGK